MINRLTYEIRLKPLKKGYRSKIHKKWRWDVTIHKTTDPEYPGVETGRQELGHFWGYERTECKALRKIAQHVKSNVWQSDYDEV